MTAAIPGELCLRGVHVQGQWAPPPISIFNALPANCKSTANSYSWRSNHTQLINSSLMNCIIGAVNSIYDIGAVIHVYRSDS